MMVECLDGMDFRDVKNAEPEFDLTVISESPLYAIRSRNVHIEA